MSGPAYYNEHDAYAAQWIRNLIAAGHVAPGDVDERSIEDVMPADLRGYTQCHFFAGIAVWSHALRSAGVSDSRAVWTGSCPCQPFSTAGKGGGFADERHLWPAFHHLIEQCRPPVVLGEQVASSDVGPWIDLVQADLEGLGYSFGAVPFPAASIGAPHIRDRLYWVADLHGAGFSAGSEGRQAVGYGPASWADCGSGWMAQSKRRNTTEPEGRWDGSGAQNCAWTPGHIEGFGALPATRSAGPLHGLWADADWLFCRDGKWRPVEPGTFPLAHGAAGRVGRLRAYGNAIVAPQAEAFIRAALDLTPLSTAY